MERLRGCTNYPVIPDRIEAGTFLMAAAITRSPLVVEPVIPEHLSAVIQKLRDCGCSIEIKGRAVTITPGEISAVDITTQPFPGVSNRSSGTVHGPDVHREGHQRDQREDL